MKIFKRIICTDFNPKSILHNILFFLLALIMLSGCLKSDVHKFETYPLPKDVIWQNQYVKQFDAFLKGQLHLDIEADPLLEKLENPYSPEERDKAGVFYFWDHAYFNGKYYSYFGIAPILSVYLPVYISSGEIPNEAYVCRALAVYAVIFMAAAFKEIMLTFCKKTNLWLFLMAMAAFISVSGVYTAMLCADVYYIPVLSALGCSMAFIFFLLSGIREKNSALQSVYMVFAALSLGLTVLSRPTAAIMCASFLPVFAIPIKNNGFKKSLGALLSFAIPLAICAVFCMWYNYARFGSVFDFGASYQLTVCDVSQNHIEKNFAFSALFSYFLHPIWETELGPALSGQIILPPEARYVYGDICAGAFAFFLPLGILLHGKNRRLRALSGETNHITTAIVFSVASISFIVAFFNFCYAGVNLRYIYDIVPILSVAGAFILLDTHSLCASRSKLIMTAVCIICFYSAISAGFDVVEILKARM